MTDVPPFLLPVPHRLTLAGGYIQLPERALIIAPAFLLFEAQEATKALTTAGFTWEIVAASVNPYGNIGLTLAVVPRPAQSYSLTISDNGIHIRGGDAAGVYYGICTLRQILRQYGTALPALSIDDSPDFAARGVMLDVSRDKVPTMDTLYALIDRLAAWKINQLQLYMEHTFAYQRHPQVWAQASPFSGQQILELDVYCRQRHIALVPNQNSLGHMERWLRFGRYLPLAECPEGFTSPWGEFRPPGTLNPRDPRSLELIAGLYEELLPHFTSGLLNVGADEPFELGLCRETPDVGRLYLEYLLKLRELARQHGRQMMFWGDIVQEHPALIPELPRDIIALEWGYEGSHDFEGHCARYGDLPFYVCPGTSSWNSFAGRTQAMIENLRSAAVCGKAQGAAGYLITDWGDRGHWQPLPISYAGLVLGAALAWCQDSNLHLTETPALASALDTFAFEDTAGIIGKLALELGSVYTLVNPKDFNGSQLFYLMQAASEDFDRTRAQFERLSGAPADLSLSNLRRVLARIDEVMAPLDSSKMLRADEALIRDEFLHAADLMRHSVNRLLLREGVGEKSATQLMFELEVQMVRHRAVWLARNRPGGLADSLARFDVLREEYRAGSRE